MVISTSMARRAVIFLFSQNFYQILGNTMVNSFDDKANLHH